MFDAPLEALGIYLHAQAGGAVHRRRERLRTPHAAESTGQDELTV